MPHLNPEIIKKYQLDPLIQAIADNNEDKINSFLNTLYCALEAEIASKSTTESKETKPETTPSENQIFAIKRIAYALSEINHSPHLNQSIRFKAEDHERILKSLKRMITTAATKENAGEFKEYILVLLAELEKQKETKQEKTLVEDYSFYDCAYQSFLLGMFPEAIKLLDIGLKKTPDSSDETKKIKGIIFKFKIFGYMSDKTQKIYQENIKHLRESLIASNKKDHDLINLEYLFQPSALKNSPPQESIDLALIFLEYFKLDQHTITYILLAIFSILREPRDAKTEIKLDEKQIEQSIAKLIELGTQPIPKEQKAHSENLVQLIQKISIWSPKQADLLQRHFFKLLSLPYQIQFIVKKNISTPENISKLKAYLNELNPELSLEHGLKILIINSQGNYEETREHVHVLLKELEKEKKQNVEDELLSECAIKCTTSLAMASESTKLLNIVLERAPQSSYTFKVKILLKQLLNLDWADERFRPNYQQNIAWLKEVLEAGKGKDQKFYDEEPLEYVVSHSEIIFKQECIELNTILLEYFELTPKMIADLLHNWFFLYEVEAEDNAEEKINNKLVEKFVAKLIEFSTPYESKNDDLSQKILDLIYTISNWLPKQAAILQRHYFKFFNLKDRKRLIENLVEHQVNHNTLTEDQLLTLKTCINQLQTNHPIDPDVFGSEEFAPKLHQLLIPPDAKDISNERRALAEFVQMSHTLSAETPAHLDESLASEINLMDRVFSITGKGFLLFDKEEKHSNTLPFVLTDEILSFLHPIKQEFIQLYAKKIKTKNMNDIQHLIQAPIRIARMNRRVAIDDKTERELTQAYLDALQDQIGTRFREQHFEIFLNGHIKQYSKNNRKQNIDSIPFLDEVPGLVSHAVAMSDSLTENVGKVVAEISRQFPLPLFSQQVLCLELSYILSVGFSKLHPYFEHLPKFLINPLVEFLKKSEWQRLPLERTSDLRLAFMRYDFNIEKAAPLQKPTNTRLFRFDASHSRCLEITRLKLIALLKKAIPQPEKILERIAQLSSTDEPPSKRQKTDTVEEKTAPTENAEEKAAPTETAEQKSSALVKLGKRSHTETETPSVATASSALFSAGSAAGSEEGQERAAKRLKQ